MHDILIKLRDWGRSGALRKLWNVLRRRIPPRLTPHQVMRISWLLQNYWDKVNGILVDVWGRVEEEIDSVTGWSIYLSAFPSVPPADTRLPCPSCLRKMRGIYALKLQGAKLVCPNCGTEVDVLLYKTALKDVLHEIFNEVKDAKEKLRELLFSYISHVLRSAGVEIDQQELKHQIGVLGRTPPFVSGELALGFTIPFISFLSRLSSPHICLYIIQKQVSVRQLLDKFSSQRVLEKLWELEKKEESLAEYIEEKRWWSGSAVGEILEKITYSGIVKEKTKIITQFLASLSDDEFALFLETLPAALLPSIEVSNTTR